MNLQKTALFAEILGGVGIIFSILYLGFEVSQSAKNTEIANHLSLIGQVGEFRLLQMSDSGMPEIILKGSFDIEDLSEVDQFRFRLYTLHSFDLWEASFIMNERDVLPAETWKLWNHGWCDWMKEPGFRGLWAAGMNESFLAGFRSNVGACYSD